MKPPFDLDAFLSDKDAMQIAILYHFLPEDLRYGIRVITRHEFSKIAQEWEKEENHE
jgi:hypothetical protein